MQNKTDIYCSGTLSADDVLRIYNRCRKAGNLENLREEEKV